MNEIIVRLNARIARQREEIRHLQFVVRQLKAQVIEAPTEQRVNCVVCPSPRGCELRGWCIAQGTEARRAETENTGSVHDGPVAKPCAQKEAR